MKKLSLGLAFIMTCSCAAQAQVFSSQQEDGGVYEHRYEPQRITVINNGLAALKERLDMINSAKKSIEMEYFIYSIDKAGRLITQALVKKAKQGVKVRLIVDTSLPIFELNKYYAQVLKEAGIDPTKYRGFAWGGGIERLVMLKYGIEDLRHFESAKLAFLRKFAS